MVDLYDLKMLSTQDSKVFIEFFFKTTVNEFQQLTKMLFVVRWKN